MKGVKQLKQLEGIAYLRHKLNQKRGRVLLRYSYYESKEPKRNQSVVIPSCLKNRYPSTLGWCSTAVDFLADRLVVEGFENDDFNIMQIYNLNNPDVIFDSAILSALIASCSFISISADEDGFPRMEVIDAANATGVIDTVTGLLVEGYAVLERDKKGNPTIEAYYYPGGTDIYYSTGQVQRVKNAAPYPLLVPVINRPDTVRPFGHSRISRACMDLQEKARATITRSEITAEFYSFPQKYVLGLTESEQPFEKERATISSFMAFYKDDDGDKPTVGQFQQSSVEPFINQFRLYAAAFCGETGLTLDDIGFISDNPASAEAIKAGHESLRNTARKAQRNFGSGLVNAGYLAACVRDEKPYKRAEVYNTTVKWQPIIEPDAAALAATGDAVLKINQAVPDYIGTRSLERLIGVKAEVSE